MKYKLITNKAVLNGTCYFEFLPGKYQGKSWNEDSVFLTEGSIAIFEYILKEVDPNYDHYAFNEFSTKQINNLVGKLKDLLDHIKQTGYAVSGTVFSEKYYKKVNDEIGQNKDSILRMLRDLINWIKVVKTKFQVLSILGV